jgi:hypothetical protein
MTAGQLQAILASPAASTHLIHSLVTSLPRLLLHPSPATALPTLAPSSPQLERFEQTEGRLQAILPCHAASTHLMPFS